MARYSFDCEERLIFRFLGLADRMMKGEGSVEGRFLQERDKCGTHLLLGLGLRRSGAVALRIPLSQLYLEPWSSFQVLSR